MIHKKAYLLLSALWSMGIAMAAPEEAPTPIDTVIFADRVQVTAIKQGMALRSQPVASTVLGERTLRREGIDALKKVSELVPNLFIPDYGSRMTSSLYVRGLGARIDQPVIGMNVDNVPILNKNNYDFELSDVERIEVLRGPQSTLYGRNTMGGVINIYTLSPLSYQGVRAGVEYGSGNTLRLRASTYHKLREGLGIAAAAWYTQSDGFFENLATAETCDREKLGGGRIKLQWRNAHGLRLENTASFSMLTQGGYPYASVETGEVNYNDPSTYDRTHFSNGFTLRYDTERLSVASITSYQYTDDDMRLDQDFLPVSYFTLQQAVREHTVTEDIVVRSNNDGSRYQWLVGAFGFYRHGRMDAPVLFKQEGIEKIIVNSINENDPEYTFRWLENTLLLDSRFRMPGYGAALYHESNLRAGRWHFTLGLRVDYEHSQLYYDINTDTRCLAIRRTDGMQIEQSPSIHEQRRLRQSFVEVLPKAAVRYEFATGSLYASVAKGYKAGGFNTQMFSDVLQQKMMAGMGVGTLYDPHDVVTYKPEKSWNYELGGRFATARGTLRGDFALFWIDCRDQQLTVFPDSTQTGRLMTNAGRTRSMGGELSLEASLTRQVDLRATYGYTHATFRSYNNGREDFRGNRIPYVPEHTASLRVSWAIPTNVSWLGEMVLSAGARGAGAIRWNEQNTLTQPFYVLADASVGFEHKHYSLSFWGRNLGGTRYNTFYFESIGNAFLQRGRPRTFGISLSIHIQTNKK